MTENQIIENIFTSLKSAEKQIEEWEYAGDTTPYVIVERGNSYSIISLEVQQNMQKLVEKEYNNFYSSVFSLLAKKIADTQKQFFSFDITLESFKWRMEQAKMAEETFLKIFDNFIYVDKKDKVFHSRAHSYMKDFLSFDITADSFNSKMTQLSEAMEEIPGTKAYFKTTARVREELVEKLNARTINALETIRAQYLHQDITKEVFQFRQRAAKLNQKTVEDFISFSKAFEIITPTFTYLKEVNEAGAPHVKTNSGSNDTPQNTNLFETLFGVYDYVGPEEVGTDIDHENTALPAKRKKSITIKLAQIAHIILNNCLRYLQGKNKHQHQHRAPGNRANRVIGRESGLENAKIYVNLKETIEKTSNIHYKEKLIKIIDNILLVYATEHLFLQLEPEKKFDLAQVYPELIRNFQKQCVLDYENVQLIGKKDDVLEGALDKFLEKVQHIFEEKFILDSKQTQVLKQYLTHKR